MFSVQQKREISEAVQKILRESQKQRNAKAPELKLGKPVRVQRTCCALAEDCESCGNEAEKKTAMIAACGTGLSVCDNCRAALKAIGWKPL